MLRQNAIVTEGTVATGLTHPAQIRIAEDRPFSTAWNAPRVGIYDFNALTFPNSQGPVIRNNPNVTLGANMVLYDGQQTWNRHAIGVVGPVREFFGRMLDRRKGLKHI